MQSKNNYIMPIKRLILACNFCNEKVGISKMFVTLCFIKFINFESHCKTKFLNFLKMIQVKVWLLGLEYGYLDLLILYFSKNQQKICTCKMKYKK